MNTEHALQLIASGRWSEARQVLHALLVDPALLQAEVDEMLPRCQALLMQRNHGLASALVALFRGVEPIDRLFEGVDARRAAELSAWHHARTGNQAAAAEAFLRAERWAHAALALQRAGEPARAHELWLRLLQRLPTQGNDGGQRAFAAPSGVIGVDNPVGHGAAGSYLMALLAFQLGRGPGKQPSAQESWLVSCQRHLEAAACAYGEAGESERAFDCYVVLSELGHVQNAFENLIEGFLGCARVVREDGLHLLALSFLQKAAHMADAKGEYHAAATIWDDAAKQAAATGLPYVRSLREAAGAAWLACARRYRQLQMPQSMVRHALLASAHAFVAADVPARAAEAVGDLAQIAKGAADPARYEQIVRRLLAASGTDQPAGVMPPETDTRFANVWEVDLLEWDLAGDPFSTAIALIGSAAVPIVVRRRALALALLLVDGHSAPNELAPEQQVQVARTIGELRVYDALAPLERLFLSNDAAVRRAVVQAIRGLPYKRSFGILRRALCDPANVVVQEATRVLARFQFAHALAPLAAIARGATTPEVRYAALEAIGRIQTPDAFDFVLRWCREDPSPPAISVLGTFRGSIVAQLAREAGQLGVPDVIRSALERII